MHFRPVCPRQKRSWRTRGVILAVVCTRAVCLVAGAVLAVVRLAKTLRAAGAAAAEAAVAVGAAAARTAVELVEGGVEAVV